eukprot:s3489_g2.t1
MAMAWQSFELAQRCTACRKGADWQGALSLLREPGVDIVVVNLAIGACARAIQWEAALQLLHHGSIQPSLVSFNTAMSACIRGKEAQKALQLFDALGSHAQQPNVLCYSSATSACEKSSQWQRALALFTEMNFATLEGDTIHYNAVVSSLARARQWKIALSALAHMEASGVQPDVVSYNAAVAAFARDEDGALGNWVKAVALLAEMKTGHRADLVTYGTMVTTLAWSKCLMALQAATSHSFVPNVVALGASALACNSDSAWRWSLKLAEAGAASSEHLAMASVSAHASDDKAKARPWSETLRSLTSLSMRGVKVNLIMINVALKALQPSSSWRPALALLQAMPKKTLTADAVSIYSTMDVCLGAGQWAAAFSLSEALEALGIHSPTPALKTYNHHEQAGSIMDCLKHSLLVLLLQHYAADSQPFTYIDGHAGRGIYDLGENLTEFQNYGLHLLERHHHRRNHETPWAVASLLEANRRLNGPNDTRWYLGSPSLATGWIRQQDRMTALEASQEHEPALEAAFGRLVAADVGSRRFDIRRENSYLYLSDLSMEGKGLILLDPPYEPYSQYLSWNLWTIHSLRSRWPA